MLWALHKTADNKKSWKAVKPLISNKAKSNDKIISIEEDSTITQEAKVPEFTHIMLSAERVGDPNLKAIVKERKNSCSYYCN